MGDAVSMADRALVWQVRAFRPWLCDEWEAAVLRELTGKKSTAEKCRRNLIRLAKLKEDR